MVPRPSLPRLLQEPLRCFQKKEAKDTAKEKNDETTKEREQSYNFMSIENGATYFIYATHLDSQNDESGLRALRDVVHHMQVRPKRIVVDSTFMEPT